MIRARLFGLQAHEPLARQVEIDLIFDLPVGQVVVADAP